MKPAWWLDCIRRPIPATYKSNNWPAFHEALKRRGSLKICFDPEMRWDAAISDRGECQQTFGETYIHACLTKAVFLGNANCCGKSHLRLVGPGMKALLMKLPFIEVIDRGERVEPKE